MEDVTSLFLKLVAITSPSGQEKVIGAFIKNYLKKRVDYLYEDKAGNLFAKKGSDRRKPLLLCAHMDTVNPVSSDRPIIKNGLIQASGSGVLGADDKSAVAAILSLLEEIKDINHRPLEILITVREETDAGIREFPKHKIKSTEALLADIARPIGTVVTAAPYVVGYSIKVEAPGGHVGLTTKKTIHPLTFLREFMKRIPYGRVSEYSIHNIAIITMGKSYNSVPQELHFTGELRTFSQLYYKAFLKKLTKTVVQLDKKTHTKSKLDIYPYCLGYILKTRELKNIMTCLKINKIAYAPLKVFSVGDFNILREWGISPINIGTGGKDAHTTYESISIESLKKLKKIFLTYIQ